MRVAYFDLECTSLKGDVGRILVGSILLNGEMTTFRQDEIKRRKRIAMSNDGPIAVAIRDHLETAHMVVGWHSKGFDIPFLNTRLVANGERTITPSLHLDPMWQMRGWRGLAPRNSKLSTVAEFFKLGERKQSVDVEEWIKAQMDWNEEAMDILCERCESDVRLLAEITEHILDAGLVRNIMRYP